MENEQIYDNTNELYVTDKMRESWLKASKWGAFFNCIAVIGLAFMLIGGLILLLLCAIEPESNDSEFIILGIIYTIMGIVYIYPITKQFAIIKNIRKSMNENSQQDFENIAVNTHKILRFYGWFFISIIIIYILAIIGILTIFQNKIFG